MKNCTFILPLLISFATYSQIKPDTSNLSSRTSVLTELLKNSQWYSRGPYPNDNNIPFPTRIYNTIERDLNDIRGNKYWLGSKSGLWYNNDITNIDSPWITININPAILDLNVGDIEINKSNPNEMLISTGNYLDYTPNESCGGGIYRSQDGGLTWSLLESTLPNCNLNQQNFQSNFAFIRKLKINSLGYFFAISRAGLIKSVDKGLTWTKIFTPPSLLSLYDIEISDDDILFISSYHSSLNSVVYKSQDINGLKWQSIYNSSIPGKIEIEISKGTSHSNATIILAGQNTAFYLSFLKKSINGGSTWSDISLPSNINNLTSFMFNIKIHPKNKNIILLGSHNLFKSYNQGQTWISPSNVTNLQGSRGIEFGLDNISVVNCNESSGVTFFSNYLKETQNSLSSIRRNFNLNASSFQSVSMFNTAYDSEVVGNDFSITSEMFYGGIGQRKYNSSQTIIDQNEPEIVISGRNTFNLYNKAGTFITELTPTFTFSNDYDYINNDFISFKSNNLTLNTTTFNVVRNVGKGNVKSNITLPLYIMAYYIKFGKSQGVVFIGTNDSKLYKIVDFFGSNPSINLIYSKASGSIALGETENEILMTNQGQLFYSNDGGVSWSNKNFINNNKNLINKAIKISNPNLTLVASDAGVYYSENISSPNTTWQKFGVGLPTINCSDIYFRQADSVIAIATSASGLYNAKIGGLQKQQIAIDKKFNLINVCKGQTLQIPFKKNGNFLPSTVFTAQLITSTGNFTPINIGSLIGTQDSIINCQIPQSITSMNFRIRVNANELNIIGSDNGYNLSLSGTTTTKPELNISDTKTLCPEKEINLIARCTSSVEWSNGQFGNSIYINQSGTYSAKCGQLSCESPFSSGVTILPTNQSLNLNGVSSSFKQFAIQNITTSQKIENGTNTVNSSNGNISIIPPFEAKNGSIFEAKIGVCEN